MKRIKNILSIIVFIFTLSSCDYKFDIESSIKESKLRVEGIVGLVEHNANRSFGGGVDAYYSEIRVDKVIPVGVNYSSSDFIFEVEEISLKSQNGSIEVEKVDNHYGIFESNYTPTYGDELELRIKAKGLSEVSAKTTVPNAPVMKLNYEIKEGLIFNIDLSSTKSTGLYAISVFGSEVRSYRDEETGNLEDYARSEYLSLDRLYSDVSLLESLSGGFKEAYWEGAKISFFREEDLESGILNFVLYESFTDYTITVYSLSEEAYAYLNALYNQDHNILGNVGLSPPNYAYSNIKNGFGVFGCANGVSEKIKIDPSSWEY